MILLLLSLALGQQGVGPHNGGVSRGNFLRIPDYKTTGTVALFVDPAGNDSNDCASVGTPCLTLGGVAAKIPFVVRYPITVTFANGSYTGGFVRNHQWDPATSAGAYIVLKGTLTTFTPATGSATGTATSAATCGAAPIVKASLTDSTATWTTNDLRGYLLETTGGTGSGQFMPIVSNTGTVMTVTGCWTVTPDATTTYAIRTWGAQITTPGAQQPGDYLNGPGTGPLIGITNIGLGATRFSNDGMVVIDSMRTVGAANALYVANAHVLVRRSRLETTNASNSINFFGPSPRLNILNSSVISGTGYTVFEFGPELGNNAGPSIGGSMQLSNSFFQTGATSLSGMFLSMPGAFMFGVTLTLTNSGAAKGIWFDGAAFGGLMEATHINCTAGGSTIGIYALNDQSDHAIALPTSVMALDYDSGEISECPTSVSLGGPLVQFTTDEPLFQATAGTTAILMAHGAQVLLDTNAATSGSFTNQLNLDSGAITANFSDVSGTTLRNPGTNTGVVSIP